MADVRLSVSNNGSQIKVDMLRKLISGENLCALLLCLALIAILIATADQAPQWIYQGF